MDSEVLRLGFVGKGGSQGRGVGRQLEVSSGRSLGARRVGCFLVFYIVIWGGGYVYMSSRRVFSLSWLRWLRVGGGRGVRGGFCWSSKVRKRCGMRRAVRVVGRGRIVQRFLGVFWGCFEFFSVERTGFGSVFLLVLVYVFGYDFEGCVFLFEEKRKDELLIYFMLFGKNLSSCVLLICVIECICYILIKC